jgi:hypothetical protein
VNPVQTLKKCLCGDGEFSVVFEYVSPPEGETAFSFSPGCKYQRNISKCDKCGHYLSMHDMDLTGLYDGDYVDALYQDDDKFLETFYRIRNLDKSESDNFARVDRVLGFAKKHLPGVKSPKALDVGSGLCVFLDRLKDSGWDCTALDTDPRQVQHAKDIVGINAILGDFTETVELGQFHLIALNKVLEHVIDPVTMLNRCHGFLEAGGFVYLEVPDGERAALDGKDREEFYIDHWHMFIPESLEILTANAGFKIIEMKRLKEPSTKYTIYAFLQKVDKT